GDRPGDGHPGIQPGTRRREGGRGPDRHAPRDGRPVPARRGDANDERGWPIMTLPACFATPDLRPETERFCSDIGRRADELILLTRGEGGAPALGDWGLLAFARPPGGKWPVQARRPLTGRDVAILNADPLGETSWLDRDRAALRRTVRRIGAFVPVE